MLRVFLGIIVFSGFLISATPIEITADKLFYRKKGDVTEFRENVKFTSEEFSGSCDFLTEDKRTQKINAKGNVFVVVKSSGVVKIFSPSVIFDRKTNIISSDEPSDFIVEKSSSVFYVNCLNFKAFPDEKKILLTGPAEIKGEGIEARAKIIYLYESCAVLEEDVFVTGEGHDITSSQAQVDFEKGTVTFTGDVLGNFIK